MSGLKKLFPLAGVLMGLASWAAPAMPGIITVVQPDGTEIQVKVCGDERCGYLTTPEGELLMEDSDGYLRLADDGYRRSVSRMRKTAANRMTRSLNDGDVPTTGTLHGLVILAEFPDVPFSEANGREAFEALLNEEGYSFGGASGSVRDYYMDQSYGQFTPVFDVAGPVRLPNEMAYYGADSNGRIDPHAYRAIEDACRLADDEVDFSKYDNNGDGVADLIYVIYSGYAQSNGASSNTIWPHMWFLSQYGVYLNLDGVSVDRYACSSERMGRSGEAITGIGLFCHEFSHTLGLPDLYDTSYSSSEIAMGEWDVMDTGGYNNSMRTPAGYSSYEKSLLGWMDPVLGAGLTGCHSLSSLECSPDALKMVNPDNPDEYFMLEVRSKCDKWDAYLPGEGLLIVKVDYDKEIWDSNAVNTGGNRGVHVIPSNGDFSSDTDGASTPFPGTAGIKVWTDLTTPSSRFSDGSYLGCAVTDISLDGRKAEFSLGAKLDSPVITDPTEITATGFRANWNRVSDAKSYTFTITSVSTGETKVHEKIVRNRFTLTDLDPNDTYVYSVRAIGTTLVSPPSEEKTITLSSLTGVEEVSVTEGDIVRIYDMHGCRLNTPVGGLSPGIYIVLTAEGHTRKFVVR